jgi:hypothetical protein
MSQTQLKCFSCQTEMSFTVAISRRDECPKCRADVRVCKNCRFYDAKVYNECRETSAEVIREKERANLCDYFQPGSALNAEKAKADLLAAAEALFRKS